MRESMQVVTQNHYKLLGVERRASVEEIKSAYHELAKIFHPDSNFYSEIIEEGSAQRHLRTFQALTEAYTTLANTRRRAEYDSQLGKELPSWDDNSEAQRDMERARQRKESGVYPPTMFGDFRVEFSAPGEDGDTVDVRPISEILRQERSPLVRLRRFFGFDPASTKRS